MRKFLFIGILINQLFFIVPDTFSQERLGDVLQLALPAAALSSTLIWQSEDKATLQFIKATGSSILVTHTLKWIIDKPRPDGGSCGFPSGHTSIAFMGAAFLQKRYGWKAGLPALAIASYVGWTRIDAHKHDFYDVLGGALIGIGSAYLFTKPYKESNLEISFSKQNVYYTATVRYYLN